MKKNTKKKRKSSSKSKKSVNLKFLVYLLLLIVISLGAFIVGILYTQKNYEKELKKTQNSIKVLQEKINKLKQQNLQKKTVKKTKPKPKPKHQQVSSEIIDYKKSQNTTKPTQTTAILHPKIPIGKRPKLVIIIDDVSFKEQVKRIKQIPYKITPSFFPPTQRHPNTSKYAQMFSHYMIHLPLEAIHFHKPEPKTLNTTDSFDTVLERIKEVKKEFPRAEFINNHTGSTFTSDKEAMLKLFKALKEENLGFVDSKTTANSKARLAKSIYNIPLFSRNIFLDNEENPSYIRSQLKKAVKLAKKHGYAIAIGHPHTVTLVTLKNSGDILKNVNVVYIDELVK